MERNVERSAERNVERNVERSAEGRSGRKSAKKTVSNYQKKYSSCRHRERMNRILHLNAILQLRRYGRFYTERKRNLLRSIMRCTQPYKELYELFSNSS